MNNSETGGNDYAANSAKNTALLRNWAAAWVITTAIATFGPKLVWDFATVPTVGAVLLSLGVGLGMIVANKRYVQGLDEMQQKIFLQAGARWVSGWYVVSATSNLRTLDSSPLSRRFLTLLF